MTTSEAVGREIRAQLVRRGHSAQDLAQVLGLSGAAVSRRLGGHVEWTVGELAEACDFLGMTATELLALAAQPLRAGVA